MSTLVVKIGGENASDPRTAEWIAEHSWDHTIIPVISAFRTKALNTTDTLIRARQLHENDSWNESMKVLEWLFSEHEKILLSVYGEDSARSDVMRTIFDRHFHESDFDGSEEERFIWYGEIISAQILWYILRSQYSLGAQMIDHRIDAPDAVSFESDLAAWLPHRIRAILNAGKIPIVPWYIATAQSYMDLYGRSYSDKTAERVAVGLAQKGTIPELHIHKQVPIFSTRPGDNVKPRVLWEIDYWTSAEITGTRWANAQVLHKYVISPDLTRYRIPIHVYNPFEDWWRTIIHEHASEKGIVFVDRKETTLFQITGPDMSSAWLFKAIDDVFAKHGVSLDSTPATQTQIEIQTEESLEPEMVSRIEEDLRTVLWTDYSLRTFLDVSMIHCIGNDLDCDHGFLGKLFTLLGQEQIRILTIGTTSSRRNIILGVSRPLADKLVQVVHTAFIAK